MGVGGLFMVRLGSGVHSMCSVDGYYIIVCGGLFTFVGGSFRVCVWGGRGTSIHKIIQGVYGFSMCVE